MIIFKSLLEFSTKKESSYSGNWVCWLSFLAADFFIGTGITVYRLYQELFLFSYIIPGALLHPPLSLGLVKEGPKLQATETMGTNETTRVVVASAVASRKAAPWPTDQQKGLDILVFPASSHQGEAPDVRQWVWSLRSPMTREAHRPPASPVHPKVSVIGEVGRTAGVFSLRSPLISVLV